MSLDTLANVKARLGVTSSADDTLIGLLQDSGDTVVANYCNRDFAGGTFTEYFPGGSEFVFFPGFSVPGGRLLAGNRQEMGEWLAKGVFVMARPSKPWYRAERKAWFVTIAGRVYNLGQEEEAAYKEFYRLLGGVEPEPLAPGPITLEEVIDRYLLDLAGRVKSTSFRTTKGFLKPISRAIGRLPAPAVRREDVKQAIEGRATWGSTAKFTAYGRLAACLNWALQQTPSLIPANVVRGIPRPTCRARSSESVPGPEDFERLRVAAKPHLRDVLEALYDTGARPGEVIRVTAGEFSAGNATWILPEHKTAHRIGRPRVIHLTARVVETCVRLAKLYPSGPLYRTSYKVPYRNTCKLSESVRHLRWKLGLSQAVVPYGLRHAFTSDALLKGIPDTVVAALLGHTSTTMIHKFYSHVNERSRELKSALDKIRSPE
jgi:integrase